MTNQPGGMIRQEPGESLVHTPPAVASSFVDTLCNNSTRSRNVVGEVWSFSSLYSLHRRMISAPAKNFSPVTTYWKRGKACQWAPRSWTWGQRLQHPSGTTWVRIRLDVGWRCHQRVSKSINLILHISRAMGKTGSQFKPEWYSGLGWVKTVVKTCGENWKVKTEKWKLLKLKLLQN